MTISRTTRFTLGSADVGELLARRAVLIERIRADYPGLTRTVLSRLEDGSFTDVWHWASREQMQDVLAAVPTLPEAGGLRDHPRQHCRERRHHR